MSSNPLPEVTAEALSAAAPKKKKKKRKKSTSDVTVDVSTASTKLSLKKRLFLQKSAKQTPWYDADELLNTGRGLLLALKLFPSPHDANTKDSLGATNYEVPLGLTPDEYTQLQAALRRIAVWRGRSDRGGRLPHAVDVTAGLAGVLLMDAERSTAAAAVNCGGNHSFLQNNVSLYQLRNSYSTLLLRSVNGLADTYRHQKKSALLSVAHCCSLAGLPLWIVDIRHDASHNDLPSLGVCRIGALESLKFWKGRYWDALSDKVWGKIPSTGSDEAGVPSTALPEAGVCTLAMDCLARYQKATEMEAVERRKMMQNRKYKPEKKEYQRLTYWQQFSRQQKQAISTDAVFSETKPPNGEKDEIILLPSDEDTTKPEYENSAKKQKVEDNKVNPWWILGDNKPKKKKIKKAQSDDSMEADGSADAGLKTDESQTQAVPAGPSSRDIVAEFIRTIPIDIVFSTALRFLVWGGAFNISAENVGDVRGPALLNLLSNSSASSSQVDLDEIFEELRVSHEWLIVSVAGIYPGFFSALFVHLVDSILCLDGEMQKYQQEMQQEESNDNNNSLEDMENNLRILFMWACYLLTREFNMHLDRSVAVVNQTADGQPKQTKEPVDLKKKGRRKWTNEEEAYMQSPIPYQLLRDNGIPMNSVCDRLFSHLAGAVSVEPVGESKSVVMELLGFFESILGEERIFFCVSKEHPGLNCTKDASEASTPYNTVQPELKPWTLCKSWDACAIGTMPGFPA